ncbi:hypothetical protein AWC23_16880 [Mycobacterium saskatchewanense]|uniref:Transmembrane protein n=2 Tax=Mycobacterium saskatchewanense TaxID=220927 RepID=A0AAJ3NNI2_9MYCO|nr:hypothetical protein [Mycobacterium saskatchewanense]ORW70577.1 hypothetical protein AWC23_16880 [Mycobacterium saskatchewanense]
MGRHPPRKEVRTVGADGRAAARFALMTAMLGLAFLIVAALSVKACDGPAPTDSAACGAPVRIALGLGAPVILFMSGVWAFVRTYRLWRDREPWWAWQGAGWFLLLLMVLTLTTGLPPIAGPALGG